jgi:hypothetical protein
MNYIALIDYFKRGIVIDNENDKIDFKRLNKKAVKFGYIVKPECCNKYVEMWLNTLTTNYNATFYKTWNDIINKNRFELYLDQLLHYASTYGQDHEIEGNDYVPNDGAETPEFKDLKVIEPITEEELVNKCYEILKSGIALKTSTMMVLSDCYLEIMKFNKSSDNHALSRILTEIKNKEAVCYISSKMDVMPNDEFGILRCIIYRYTGKMLLIQDKVTLSVIRNYSNKWSTFKSPLLYLTDKQLEKLSRIFLRFKALFLAMKGNSKVNHVVNRLRRLAVKNHTPLKAGFWENIITTQHPIKEVKEQLENIDNFRKIRLMMTCKHHLNSKTTSGLFTIRNGKQFIRTNYNPKYNINWISKLYSVLMDSLCKSLRKKKCTIRLPKDYDIALPTSEKNFIGNFPYGTSFDMDKNNVIGIYWRNEWGTRDFDLSMVDIYGNRIAWNSDYYYRNSKCGKRFDVVYSGDMTNADPEATELLYMRKNAPDGVIMVNKYSSSYYSDEPNKASKLRFFYASEHIDKVTKNYMVDPNNIKFDNMIEFEAKDIQKTIGFTFDNRFYLMDMITGKSRVSNLTSKYSDVIMEANKNKAKSFISLKEVLLNSGFEVLDDECEVDAKIDFRNLEKDTLIDLLKD